MPFKALFLVLSFLLSAATFAKESAPAHHSEATASHQGEASATKEGDHAKSHRKAGEVDADKAWSWLKNGNKRFTKGSFRKDGAQKSDIERLSTGQKPHSIVLSCSDSRVPPEVVFDQKLGEVFVVRTAGQSLDTAAVASIEYAVEHLGSNLIVIMGHEACGAVKATLSTGEGQSAGSPSLDALVKNIKPRVAGFSAEKHSDGFIKEGWANVTGTHKELLEKSQIVRDAVQSGDVKIQSALYHLKSGNVEWKTEKF